MDAPRLRPIQLLPRDPAPTLEERVAELEASHLADQLQMALMQGVIERLHVRLQIEEAKTAALAQEMVAALTDLRARVAVRGEGA